MKLRQIVSIDSCEKPHIDSLLESVMYTFSGKAGKVFYTIRHNEHFTIPKQIDIPVRTLVYGGTVFVPVFEIDTRIGQTTPSSDYGQQCKQYQIVMLNKIWDTQEGGEYWLIGLENK